MLFFQIEDFGRQRCEIWRQTLKDVHLKTSQEDFDVFPIMQLDGIFLLCMVKKNVFSFLTSADLGHPHPPPEVPDGSRSRRHEGGDPRGGDDGGRRRDRPRGDGAAERPDPLVQRPEPHPDAGTVPGARTPGVTASFTLGFKAFLTSGFRGGDSNICRVRESCRKHQLPWWRRRLWKKNVTYFRFYFVVVCLPSVVLTGELLFKPGELSSGK